MISLALNKLYCPTITVFVYRNIDNHYISEIYKAVLVVFDQIVQFRFHNGFYSNQLYNITIILEVSKYTLKWPYNAASVNVYACCTRYPQHERPLQRNIPPRSMQRCATVMWRQSYREHLYISWSWKTNGNLFICTCEQITMMWQTSWMFQMFGSITT